jgi:membrane protein DedA with SNARE-associated domain
MSPEAFLERLAALGDSVWLQALALFAAPFVLEEGALLAGAMLAAAGSLPAAAALGAVCLGIIVSDWALYGLGRAVALWPWLRRRIGETTIRRGQELLRSNFLSAMVSARLIPWLLFPIFVASGYLAVGFLRFLLVNAAIAVVYACVLFLALFYLDSLLFDLIREWSWTVVVALILGVVWLKRRAQRRVAGK